MPVKNAGDFLAPCLESILAQTVTDWELIAINDQSIDSSELILDEYSSRDRRMQYQKNNGSGIIDALRQAYSLSTGDFITRMDADDLMLPNKLEILRTRLTLHGSGHIAIGCVEYISETKLGDGYKKYANWLNGLTQSGKNWLDIYKECVIPSPAWMASRNDLDKSGAFSFDYYPEDYDLCFRFYKAGLSCIASNQIVHKWRDHANRTSRTSEVYRDNRFLNLKMKYFIALDYDQSKSLVLWGAGKKGKEIAQILESKNINFKWISNNPKKIGHTIYKQIIESESKIKLDTNQQVLVAIANQPAQEKIEATLLSQQLRKGKDYFFFC